MSQKFQKGPRCPAGLCQLEQKVSTSGSNYTVCSICSNFPECDHVGATLIPTVAASGRTYNKCSKCGGGVFAPKKFQVSTGLQGGLLNGGTASLPSSEITRAEFDSLKRDFFALRQRIITLETKNDGSGLGRGRQESSTADYDGGSQPVGADGVPEGVLSPLRPAKRAFVGQQ